MAAATLATSAITWNGGTTIGTSKPRDQTATRPPSVGAQGRPSPRQITAAQTASADTPAISMSLESPTTATKAAVATTPRTTGTIRSENPPARSLSFMTSFQGGGSNDYQDGRRLEELANLPSAGSVATREPTT